MHGHPRKTMNQCQGSNDVIILLWWGVSYDSVTSLNFCEKCVNTAARNYQRNILTTAMKPLNQTCSTIDHGYSNRTLHLCIRPNTHHVLKFISSDHWPSVSPDLNPLDYKFWSVLEGMVCKRRHHNLESLKQTLVDVDNFPMDVIRTAIDARINRLRRCIRANGGQFE